MIIDDKVIAPFSDEEVEALNRWQQSDSTHAFTCGVCRDNQTQESIAANLPLDQWPYNQFELIATNDGWVCGTCDYTQDWAHIMMLNKPVNIWEILKQQNET